MINVSILQIYNVLKKIALANLIKTEIESISTASVIFYEVNQNITDLRFS